MAIDDFSLSRGGAPSANTRSVKIPTYQQRTSPSGQINTRAANVQVSDAVGQALGNIGAQAGRVADYEIEQEKQRQRIDANTAYAKDAGNLGQWYIDANQNIKAGGVGFTKQVMDGSEEFIKKAVEGKPEYYKQEYERHMRARQAHLVQQAQIAEIQEGARYKLESISTDVQATVNRIAQNPDDKDYQSELKRLNDVIDSDPSLRVDVKAKAKENIKEQLSWAMAIKKAEAAAKGVPAGGAPATYGPTALANAIYGQESNSGKADTSKVNSQNVTGPMQMQQGTFEGMKKKGLIPADYDWKNPQHNKDAGFKWVEYLSKKYEGDSAKVAAAYYGGEGAVNADGTINRQWKNKQRPNDPTVGEYVDQVLARVGHAGRSAGTDGAVKVAAAPGANLSEIIGPAFTALSFDKQMQIQRHYDQQFKHEQSSKIASLAIESAATVVGAAPLEAGQMLDIPALKEQAVTQAETRLGQKLDAQQRLTVENNVEKQVSDRERDFKRSQEADVQQAFATLDKNGGDYQALVRDNPAVIQRVGRDGADRLQKYAGEVALGGTRATDWQAYSTLLNDPAMLKQANLEAMKDKFNLKEFTQLQKLQQHLKTAPQAEDNILGDKALVGSMLGNAGVKDEKKEAQFYSLLQQAIDQELAATGKKGLTQERKKELAADLLVQEITSKGTLWDSKEKAFLIKVPDNEKTKIVAALSEAGMPATEYNILRAYRNKLNKKPVLNQPVKQSPLVQQIPQ